MLAFIPTPAAVTAGGGVTTNRNQHNCAFSLLEQYPQARRFHCVCVCGGGARVAVVRRALLVKCAPIGLTCACAHARWRHAWSWSGWLAAASCCGGGAHGHCALLAETAVGRSKVFKSKDLDSALWIAVLERSL